MKGFSRGLLGATLLVVVGFLLLGGTPVYAIGDPDYVAIGDVYVFGDALEVGDQLYFVRYDVSYATNQTEDAEDTWQMALYDSSGALVATRPLNYYQHNIIAIYLTPSQAIVWEGLHTVRVMGMPSVFSPLVEGTNMRSRTLAPGDYYEEAFLGGVMVTQAGILESDWGITLLTASDKLNSTGSFYFTKAIPGLGSIAPEIFETTTGFPPVDYQGWNQDYAASLQEHEGDKLRAAIAEVGKTFGMSEGWMGFLLVGLLSLLVMAAVYPGTGNPMWGMVMAFAVLAGAAWLGLGTSLVTLVIVILLIVALLFGILFILGRFG